MRLYNGCPDSALQAKLDADAKARADLRAAGMHATYFHLEGAWRVCTLLGAGPWREITGFHPTLQAAAAAALATINAKEK